MTTQTSVEDDDNLELTPIHAVGFIVMSSGGLLALFYLKLYGFVRVMYAIGGMSALTIVLFLPLTQHYMERCCGSGSSGDSDRRRCLSTWIERFNNTPLGSILGQPSPSELIATTISFGLILAWLIITFTKLHPSRIAFHWILQDVMGVCFCINFLSTIHLKSLKTAAILLSAAFFYDVFFVFVTPLLTKNGHSVMVDVATSGGPPKGGASWCEKYPKDDDCKGGDPLPMLLTIPVLFDYRGGSSMLGLGDIILPGLLLAYAARTDVASKVVGILRVGSGRRSSIFLPVLMSYGVGLALANLAVNLTGKGQPALFYLVPCTVGCTVLVAYKNGELRDIWNGRGDVMVVDRMMSSLSSREGGRVDSSTYAESNTSSLGNNDAGFENDSSSCLDPTGDDRSEEKGLDING